MSKWASFSNPFHHITHEMNPAGALPFRKMNGLGNDFVVLDGRVHDFAMDAVKARAIADRKTGIGCDQLIVLEKSDVADVRMLVWNNGGGQVESCGNASRCVADMLFDEKKTTTASIDTLGGFLVVRKAGDRLVTVDNGAPRFDWKDIPLSEPFHDTRHIELQVGPIEAPLIHSPSVVNVGNPHCIFWVKDLDVVDLSKVGPMLEQHHLFPEGANISLARVDARDHVTLKVWERSAGLTLACGTAACAVLAAGVRINVIDHKCRVSLPGGDLFMEWRASDGHVLMTGPVAYEFDGVLPAGLHP
jgi:diaminopimelate epimerase